MSTVTTTPTAAAVEDLLVRAEHASLALSSTWDTTRGRRLAKLIKRYGDRAQAVVMADPAVNGETYRTAFRVAAMGLTAARTARTIALSNGVDIHSDGGAHWRFPLR